ncbi:MAG TPA: protein kinase [Polyangiaceae bacterium]
MTQPPQFQQGSPYPQQGDVLDGKYRIERLLGEGGMGAVAKATHLLRRAPVALKFMSPAVLALQGAVERFVNEGVAASQIDSDHVVKVFDVGRMPNGAPYLVMEFLDGRDLQQILIVEGGRIHDAARAVHFALQILRALQTAHGAGIIHRDMKPSNCFVIEKDGEPDFVKLVDFGISKVRSDESQKASNLTRTNSALGTPLYMSPEQARSPRDVDHRTDLYSVGAILYELLTGRTPYTAESGEYTEILFKIFTTDPEPLRTLRPDVPEGLAAAVHRALTRDVNVRFGSAGEMAEALAPFADERSSQILARLRGGRGRSMVPAQQPSRGPYTPSGPPVVSDNRDPALAGTFAGVEPTFHGAQPESLKAPRVPTDVGVTRETQPSGSPAAAKKSKAPMAIGLVAGGFLILGAAGVVVAKRTVSATHVTQDPTGSVTLTASATAPPPSATPGVSALPPAPSASLEPLPSASAVASASAAPGSPQPARPAPPPGPGTPGNKPHTLGDLNQLH